jgi:hypothetical protein
MWARWKFNSQLVAAYLILLEITSWLPAPRGAACVVNPANYGGYYAEHNECPTFHVFLTKLFSRVFEMLSNPNWIIAIFTVVLAGSTIALWVVTWQSGVRQSRDMEGAIAAAKDANDLNRNNFTATQRPWLKVTVELASGFTSDGKTGTVGLAISAKNMGASPAFNVNCNVMTYPNIDGETEVESYRMLADAVASRSIQDRGYGRVIFPNDETTFNRANVDAFWHLDNIAQGMSQGKIIGYPALTVLICISYVSAAREKHYQSGLIYALMRKIDDLPDGAEGYISFDLTAGYIRQEQLLLAQHPRGIYMV